LGPKFKKENSIMVWGGILDSGSKKILVIWEKDDWVIIMAQTYINHTLVPVFYRIGRMESYANGLELDGMPLWIIWIMEDGTSALRAYATHAWQQQHYMLKLCLASLFPRS
jgi:hypothetical protein